MLLSAVFLVFSTVTQPAEAAYSDYSVYELETKQQFASENEALQAAAKLKKDTGWQADAKKAGNAPLTYQISASGLHDETDAKTVLKDFMKQTGVAKHLQRKRKQTALRDRYIRRSVRRAADEKSSCRTDEKNGRD